MTKRAQGRPAGLSRARIAAAAMELVDRDGLDAFGVRRLASELDVDPMSIYNHIKGKAALLDAISEAVLAQASTSVTRWPDDWLDVARTLAHMYRQIAIRHPRIFPLLATRAQTSNVALDALERLTAAMQRAGAPRRVIADAPMVLFGFLNGYLLATVGSAAGRGGGPASSVELPTLDPQLHPTLAAIAPLQTGFGGEAEFERMLETVLAGIAWEDAGARVAPATKARPDRRRDSQRRRSA